MSDEPETEAQAWGVALRYLRRAMADNHAEDLKNAVKYLQRARDATWRESRERMAEAFEPIEEEKDFDTTQDLNWCGRAVLWDTETEPPDEIFDEEEEES